MRREQFLRREGTSEWPDGTVAARYGFRACLVSGRVVRPAHGEAAAAPASADWRAGRTAYGERAREIAAELAVHFERGREYQSAVQYLQQAGENALRRSANHEAIIHFTKGLELLKTRPETPERTQQELALRSALELGFGRYQRIGGP